MGAIAAYLLSVIVLPAAVSATVALALVRARFAVRAGFAQSALGAAVAVAALWSFLAEVEPAALLRQFPVEIPGDDAPFERWHRIGMAALVLAASAPIAAVSTVRSTGGVAFLRLCAVAAAAGALAGWLVPFPGHGAAERTTTAVACTLGAIALGACSARASLMVTAVSAGCTSVLAALSGFPSLAAICGCVAAASGALGAATFLRRFGRIGGWAPLTGDSPGIVAGTLLGILAACGRAYSDDQVSAAAWHAAMAMPLLGLPAALAARRAVAAAPRQERAP